MATEHPVYFFNNNITKLETTLLQTIFMLFILTVPLTAYSSVGKVLFSLGNVHVESIDSEQKKRIFRGDEINEGDTIITSENGQAQLKMADGGLIAIRPNSRFKIDTFNFDNKIDNNKTFFRLLKGSFRSVTGSIGETNKKSYKVTTPIATIGIRGTDYTARLCAEDCNNDDGLYIGVMTGGVIVTNEGGSVEIDASEYGYVPDFLSEPLLLDSAPGELLFAAIKSNQSDPNIVEKSVKNDVTKDIVSNAEVITSSAAQQDSSADSGNNGVTSEDIISTVNADSVSVYDELDDEVLTSSNQSSIILAQANNRAIEDKKNVLLIDSSTEDDTTKVINNDDTNSSTPPTDETISNIITPPAISQNNIAVSDNVFSSNGLNIPSAVYSRTASDFQVDTSQRLTSFKIKILNSDLSIEEQTVSIGTANNADSGSNAALGISWGRWESGSMKLSDGTTASTIDLTQNKLHWLVMDESEEQITLPSTGVAVYAVVGNTSPTDNFGNIGILNRSQTSLTANFSNQTISAEIKLNINDPDATNYEITAQAINVPIDNTNATFSGSMATVFANAGASGSASGQINGAFSALTDSTSNNPAGVGLTYSVKDSVEGSDFINNDITVNGAIALEVVQ